MRSPTRWRRRHATKKPTGYDKNDVRYSGELLSADGAFEAALAALRRQDGPNDPAVIAEAMSTARNLSDVCMEVHLVGPNEVAQVAVKLSDVAQGRLASTIARSQIALGDTNERREAEAARFDEWEEAWVRAFGLFIVSARAVFLGNSSS